MWRAGLGLRTNENGALKARADRTLTPQGIDTDSDTDTDTDQRFRAWACMESVACFWPNGRGSGTPPGREFF